MASNGVEEELPLQYCVETHHFAWSFLYQDPCDIFLPKALYIALHLPTIFVLVASQCMQLSIATERWIAIISADYQESSYRRLGPALIATADIVRTNIVLMFLLVMNLVGLIMTLALRYLGPKRKISMSLSSKFKAMENSIVSNYLFMISSCQFAALFFSHASILYLRIYESGNPLVTAYKENLDLFNYYTLILPVLSVFYMRKVKSQRTKNIKENINSQCAIIWPSSLQINTVGATAWMSYSAILQKQWQ
ncbi:unnamed protein product [Haemonchus placei]|uniref:Serpentine receptor class gamma n=1 Tax=Haemonchus placei TaxID=6290 RepID=A0A0N4WVD1_HAEPC|nr:unnamed protein product [Haemonchus placei]